MITKYSNTEKKQVDRYKKSQKFYYDKDCWRAKKHSYKERFGGINS